MTTLPDWESNPGPLAWGADALPTELSLQLAIWGVIRAIGLGVVYNIN